MTTTEDELDRFTQFARDYLADGRAELSLDDLFDLWRTKNPTDEQYAENVAAIAVAIEDFMKGDRGTPAGEHSEALRREFGVDIE